MNAPVKIASLPASQRGVALLECLVAMLIFSFGVIGIMGLEAKSVRFSVDAEDRNRASLIAGEVASQMWVNGTANPALFNGAGLIAYNAITTNVGNAASTGLPNGVMTVTPFPVVPATIPATFKVADIRITWLPLSDKAAPQASVLTTRVTLP